MKFWVIILTIALLTGNILTAQDAENVEFLGRTINHWAGAYDIAVQGDYAYVVTYHPGLAIVNISDLDDPFEISFQYMPGYAHTVSVAGDFAFVGTATNGLRVIDVSDPEIPQDVGGIDTPGTVREVFLAEDFAYVVDDEGGLRIIDVSDPRNLNEVGSFGNLGNMGSVYVNGDYAYVGDNLDGGSLHIINIADAENPELVGDINLQSNLTSVFVANDLAYVASNTDGLLIIDVSDPENLQQVGNYEATRVMDVEVDGDFAYLAHQRQGFRVIDVSDPENPAEHGIYDTPGEVQNVFKVDNLVYIADTGIGIGVIDVSEPDNPDLAGSYEYPDGSVRDVFISDDEFAYVADEDGGLCVVDISNPLNPLEVGRVDSFEDANSVFVVGDYAYVAARYEGFWVVDVSDPERPEEVGYAEVVALDVFVVGDFAYVACFNRGLRIIDVSDPQNPVQIGFHRGVFYLGVHVVGDFAYVAAFPSGLLVFDISDPENPNLVTTYETPDDPSNVFVVDDLAYVTIGEAGLCIIDVFDPENPAAVSSIETPDSANDVFVDGDIAYVTTDRAGIHLIDVSEPEYPEVDGFSDTPGNSWRVFVKDELIYVADQSNFGIYRFTPPAPVPDIRFVPEELDFGEVYINLTGELILTIINRGDDDLTVSDISVEGDLFGVEFDGEFVLEAHVRREVTVTFSAENVGEFEGVLTVNSDDPDNEEIDIILNAIATNDLNLIEDIVVEDDCGETIIDDLDDVFDNFGDNFAYELEDAPDELNMEIDENNLLFFNPAEDYNLPDGVDITVSAISNDEVVVQDFFNLVVTPVDDDNGEGAIVVEPEALDFGEVNVDEIGDMVLTLTNTGEVDLIVWDVQVNDEGFSADFDIGGDRFQWNFVTTDANMAIIVESAQIDDEDIEMGDCIGAFTETGLCVGFSEVEDDVVAILAWGDDNGNDVNGFVEGEDIELRMWDAEAGIEVVATEVEVVRGEFIFNVNEVLVVNIAGAAPGIGGLLEPGDAFEIPIHFSPDEAANYQDVLTISTSLNEPFAEIEVPLSGVGISTYNIIYYLYFETYIPDEGPGQVIPITPRGESVGIGDDFVIPNYDLEEHNLGGSFQNYMEAISGTTIQIEDGGIDEDIEVHLVLGNLIVVEEQDDQPPELAGIWSPDEDLQELLWMYADFQVWTVDADSVQLNDEANFEFLENNSMVVKFPLDDEFLTMMDNLALDYDNLGAGMWLPNEEEWDLNGIVSAEQEIDGENWFRIGLSHLSIVCGGPEGGFVEENRGGEGHFQYTITGENHTLIVTEATLDEEPLPVNYEIGVFTSGGLCAGAVIIEEAGEILGIAAWGDNERTREIDGFREGEEMLFRYWDPEMELEYNAIPEYEREDNGEFHDNGFSELGLSAISIRELTIPLTAGWNMISINLSPADEDLWERDEGPDVELMMEQLREDENNHHVILMKNEDGQFYSPSFGFNNIPFWELTRGYQVNVDQDVDAIWSGDPIPAGADIQLGVGWNIIAYLTTYELDAGSPDFYVLSSIIDNVLIAKDGDGHFLIPGFDFSNMPPWRETQGYQVKVDADVVLNYPEEQEELAFYPQPGNVERQDHWQEPISTGENMSLLVSLNSIPGVNPIPGDLVAVFSSTDCLVGVGTVNSEDKCGLAVWGDDISTDEVDGLKEGEAFTLKLWSSTLGAEFDLELGSILTGYAGLSGCCLDYETDGFAVIAARACPLIPDQYFLSQNYPNPFNSMTIMPYGLPESSHLSICIYDISGRLVETLIVGNTEAGYHTVSWDASTVATGVYLVKMETGVFNSVRKVILVR